MFGLVAVSLSIGQDAVRTEADGTRTLVTEVTVPAPPGDVWTAISTPEGWMTWAVPIAWAPDADTLETSYAPDAKPGDASTIRQKILAREPGKLLRFSTTKAPEGFPDFDTYSQTVTTITLSPLDGGTRVTLTQTSYPATEAGSRLIGFFEKGNRSSLEALRDRFVRGPVDWKARGVVK